jgi:hypothetical protein
MPFVSAGVAALIVMLCGVLILVFLRSPQAKGAAPACRDQQPRDERIAQHHFTMWLGQDREAGLRSACAPRLLITRSARGTLAMQATHWRTRCLSTTNR